MHLSTRAYTALQDFVHCGHRETFDLLTGLLEISPGKTVLEVGCGTGIFAQHFVDHGYDYWGMDPDPERIALARQRTTGAHFLVGDVLSLECGELSSFQRVFIHGVLHHLDDLQCRRLIDHILSLAPDVILAVIEPFRPNRWWTNPLGALFARMDEGKFVRRLGKWLDLFAWNLDSYTTRSLWPRWPVNFMDARLLSRARSLGEIHLRSLESSSLKPG